MVARTGMRRVTRIDGGTHVVDLALEQLAREADRRHFNVLTYPHLRGVGLPNIGDHPDSLQISDHEEWVGRAAADELSGSRFALKHDAPERREYRRLPRDRAADLERVDLVFGLSNQAQAVAGRLVCAFS